MNPTAIYSKSGKGVQEASGKTSNLARGDRAVLSAFDGRLTVSDVAERVGKPFDAKFEQIITQLDKDGYIREVSSGASAAKPVPGKPAPAAAKPAAAPAKSGGAPGEDLDFTIAIPASPAPKPPPAKAATMAPAAAARAETEKKAQEDNMTRARREAEERQHKERDRIKAETEAKLRVETEAKMRTEAAQKAKADAEKAKKDAEEKIRAEAEAKVKAAREAAVKAAFEAERKVKEEADRIRKEAEEKARKEAAELQRKLDEERRAREEAERARQEAERKAREAADKARQEAERKAKEEADRIRKEAEEKARKEAAELQRKLDEERRAREDVERRAREEAERAKKEAERAAREQAERERQEAESQRQEAERETREQAERLRREQEDSHAATVRAAQEAEQAARELIDAQDAHAKQQEKDKQAEAAKGGGGFDSLLADLDSFSDREDEDRKAKEEADRKAKEEKARRQRDEEEAKAREEGERKQREAAELERQLDEERVKEEGKRKAREEQEAREKREEEERKAEEKKRKRREEALAKDASTGKSDDIGVSDDDLGMDDVKADEEQVSKESRKAARAREREAKEREAEAHARAREREREAKRAASGPAVAPVGGYRPLRRRRNWGKPIALTLFVALVAGVGYLHVMPVNTQDYEKAASDAIGVPVRIGTARLSVYKGVVLNLENISVGDMKIPAGRAYPEIGSLFDEKKVLTRLDLDGVTLPQEALGALLDVKLRNDKFYVARLNARQVKLPGPLPLPTVDTEITVGPQGSISRIELRGPDNLAVKLTPHGIDVDFEATASGFTIPFLPDVTLSTFAMKGRATREAARIESWGGAIVGGAVNGNANVRWAGGTWNLDGSMTLRGINAAIFAPALLSDGNAEGTARFSMSDADPSKFKQRGRVEGSFSLNKGVLGSFDLSRAILTGGRQASGRTPFTEMTGQGIYDRGAVTLRNVTFGAGAMNATANAEISPEGALSGRIVADIRTAAQQLRATINVGGTVGEPQVK